MRLNVHQVGEHSLLLGQYNEDIGSEYLEDHQECKGRNGSFWQKLHFLGWM